MIRVTTFITGLILSIAAHAAPADLIGQWQSPCNPAGPSGGFMSTLNEFRTDGTATMIAYIYSDAQCTAVSGVDNSLDATYAATDTTIAIDFMTQGHKVNMTLNYTVGGDVLNITPTSVLVDGQPQNIPVQTVVLKRKH